MSDKTKSYSSAVLKGVIAVLFFACISIPSIADSSPSQTLIVYNNTKASIRVHLVQLNKTVEVPPEKPLKFEGFLVLGQNNLIFEAYCSAPPLTYEHSPLFVKPGGNRPTKVELFNKNFNTNFLADKEECDPKKDISKKSNRNEECKFKGKEKGGIKGQNIRWYETSSLDECKVDCCKNTRCKSIDWQPLEGERGNCMLNHKKKGDKDDYGKQVIYVDKDIYEYYERVFENPDAISTGRSDRIWYVYANTSSSPATIGVADRNYNIPGWYRIAGPFPDDRTAWNEACRLHREPQYSSPDIVNGKVNCR